MSRDTSLKLGLIGFTVIAAMLLIFVGRLHLSLWSLARPIGVICLLAVIAFYYHKRGIRKFVSCLTGMAYLVGFSASYVVLMYAIAATARPLVDDRLLGLDNQVGFHVATLVAWTRAHPVTDVFLDIAYTTLLLQTALVVLVLGLGEDYKGLEKFILRLMLCALVTAILFYFLPAVGPFGRGEYGVNITQAHYLAHLEGMRSGTRKVIELSDVEGLITFPSFHTIWAILIALAFRRRRVLFPIFAVFNGVVIFSTMSTGWHYLSDVVGGICVCAAVVIAARSLENWRYGTDTAISALAEQDWVTDADTKPV